MATVVAAVHYLVHVPLTVEDAGITFSYARTFVEGHGLGHIFENAPKAEGYSNFLWLVVMAPIGWLTNMEAASKLLGFVFALGAVVVAHRLVWHLARDRRFAWGAVAVGLIAPTAMWAAAGLENSLYVFLIVLSALLFVREDARLEEGGQPLPWSAVVLVLVAITRPEGFVYGGTIGLCKLMSAWRRRSAVRQELAHVVAWSLTLLVGIGAYTAWHYAFYRELLPSTVIAKSVTPTMMGDWGNLVDPGSEGWWQATQLFRGHGGLFLLPAAAIGFAVALRSRAVVVPALAVASLVLPVYSPDWMPQLRFLFAFPTLLVVLAVLGVDALVAFARSLRGTVVYPAAVAYAAVPMLALALFAGENIRVSWDHVRLDHPHFLTIRGGNESYAEYRAAGRALGLEDPLYVLPDVGGSTYLGRMRVVDSLGLADLQVARSKWDPKILEQYFFVERRPELVSTHYPWTSLTRIPEMPMLQRDYVRLPTATHTQFVRRDTLVVPWQDVHADRGLVAGAALVGWQSPDAVRPGEHHHVDLYWGAGTVPTDDAVFDVSIIDASGRAWERETATVGYPWLPMSGLAPGEALRRHVAIRAPLQAATYTMEVVVRPEPSAAGRVVARRTLAVDITAAAEEARVRSARALDAARDGDMAEAARGLRLALFAAGTEPHAARAVEDARDASARVAFAAAEAAWRSGDRDELLVVVRAAAELRLRLPVSAAERRFARALRDRADDGDDPVATYELLVAAAAVDPGDGVVQKQLEHARRVYLERLGA